MGDRFDARPNALNLLRLLLASTVVVHHAADFTGTNLSGPANQLLSMLPVDAFFAISGFLICRCWLRRPDVGTFLLARVRRLLPGLTAALLVTGFVVAPLLAAPSLVGQVGYVLSNVFSLGSANTDSLLGRPVWGGVWNGPLWTLVFEGTCYLAVTYLGVSGRLRTPVVAGAVMLFWLGGLAGVLADLSWDDNAYSGPRLGLMFASGALLWLLRDRAPVSATLAAVSFTLIIAGSFTPNYRLVAAPAVAYLCLYVAMLLGRYPWFVLRNDLSYGMYVYGWPLQQVLLAAGVAESWAGFAFWSLAATAPLAAVSWFFVERPAMRRGRGHRGSPVRTVRPSAAGDLAQST